MYKRPEGLSPCYFSLASPDIMASHRFRWTPSHTQTKFEIKIYDVNKILLKTHSVTSSSTEVDMSSIGYTFQLGAIYYWTVQTFNGTQSSDVSVQAKFLYDRAVQKPKISWSTKEIRPGDVIRKDSKINEVKDNLRVFLDNYSNTPLTLKRKVDDLFTGIIVPAKKDFMTLQEAIEFIGTQEGFVYSDFIVNGVTVRRQVNVSPVPSVRFDNTDPVFSLFSESHNHNGEVAPSQLTIIEWVKDSLGVSDIDKIIDYINYLTTLSPQPVKQITFDVPSTNMYQIGSITHSSDNKEDKTFDVSWAVNNMPSTTAYVRFDELSSSKDIWFYDCEFSYGPNGQHKSRIFFRPEDIIDVTGKAERSFDTNWNGLYGADELGQAMVGLKMLAVDHYANVSPEESEVKTFGTNFKIPLGVDRYVLETQKTDLSSTTTSSKVTWYKVKETSSTGWTYTTVDHTGKVWHRVKAIDKSGLETDWKYTTSPITYDPLRAPAKPKNVRQTSSTTSSVTFEWDSVPTATSYEFRTEKDSTGVTKYDGPDKTYTYTGMSSDATWDFYVRAKNGAGNSDWVEVLGTTKPDIKTAYFDSLHCHSYNYKQGWRSNQGVGHTYAYQGEWDNGGKNAGLWYFDYDKIRSTLNGKEVLEVQVSVKRLRAGYTSANYPRFYTHNRDTASWRDNHSTSPGTLTGGHQADKAFSLDERQWITLPKSYAERIRDNTATGIAIYESDGTPYLKFHNWAQLYIKYK